LTIRNPVAMLASPIVTMGGPKQSEWPSASARDLFQQEECGIRCSPKHYERPKQGIPGSWEGTEQEKLRGND